jgi:hypothetical protein
MATAGRKWPPSATHEALHSAPACQMDGQQLPEQADIFFGGVEGVYGPQNAPMLLRCIIAGTKELLRVIHTLDPPQNYIR